MREVALARIVFEKKKLCDKYGVEGCVAGHYVEAGYSVTMKFPAGGGIVSFVARKTGETLAVDVVSGSIKVTASHVEEIASKAAAIKATPVLALYGAGPVVIEEAKNKARELGVKIRRFRG